MRRLIVLTVLVVAGALSIAIVRAQQNPSDLRIEKVKDGLYIVTGGRGLGSQSGGVGGNSTVFIADTGTVLIDTKYPGLGKAILDQVKSVTSKPITTIINTHTHGDHTGGNSEFPRTVEFVAHENTKANMARMDEFKGEKAAFLPTKTYKDRMSLLGGKNPVDLYYFGPGHTDGDTVIVFPALRTAVMGDLFARKWAPLVDTNNGGSATAFPQTLAKVVSGIKNVDTVITGHSTTTIGSGARRVVRAIQSGDEVGGSPGVRRFHARLRGGRRRGEEGGQERRRSGEHAEAAGQVQELQHGPGQGRRAEGLRRGETITAHCKM